MTLKSFPRGGRKPQGKKQSESLFDVPVKSKKSRASQKRKEKDGPEEDERFLARTADRLLHTTVQEGQVILGRVYKATEYELIVSLPGGLMGRVPATDISESYTNLLQSIVKSEDGQPNEFKPLPELYQPGDYVVCCVKSVELDKKWQVVLSLEPKVVNQNVDISYLSKGSKVVCAVNSVEDHGYVIDMGLLNARAFIPSKEVNNGAAYFAGKQLLCSIKEIKTSEAASTIKLTTKQKFIDAVSECDITSLDVLMPGTKFMLHITKVLSNGLQVSFGEDHVGYVNQLYLKSPLSSYVNGMDVTGTLLYILPTVKFAYFSLLSDTPKKNTIKSGDIIENATYLYRESNGIILQLTKPGLRGFVPLKRTEVDFSEIPNKFTPGSTHKCRVLSYNLMENVYICSMQRVILEKRYFSVDDFKPGDIVNVEIKSINFETGYVQVLAEKYQAYIQPEYVSDVGLSELKKLKPGKQVVSRIMAVEKQRNRLTCTLKQSLIQSELPVLCDIHDAKCGSLHHGTIVKINKFGLLVRFFGEVKGWVPRETLNKKTSHVNWNYSIGQTVLAKIESVQQEAGKMTVSIVTDECKEEETCDFDIGEQVEGTITESSAQGVYLKISKKDGGSVTTGFLPAGHMSPCIETAALLASKCVPGDTLTTLVFATSPSLILTRTFVSQEEYRRFENLQIGDCLPCSVHDIADDGLRVILPVTDCTTLGFVSYAHVTNFDRVSANQILFAKITSLNKKEKQLGLTMSLKKIYEDVPDPKTRLTTAVDALSLYFSKLTELAKNYYYESRPISKVTLGQRVTGNIERITASGLVVQLDNNLTAVVGNGHYSGDRKVGDKVSGTIIWKNYVNEVVHITLQPAIMNRISPKQNRLPNLPVETLIRGEIIMVTSWFVLVVLKGGGKGSLAALPARRHLNDLVPDLSPYIVGVRLKCYAVLNRAESDVMPICMLRSAFEASKHHQKTKVETTAKPNLKRKETNLDDDETCTPSKMLKIKNDADEPECDKNLKKTKKVVGTNASDWLAESMIEETKDEPSNDAKDVSKKSTKIKQAGEEGDKAARMENKKIKLDKSDDKSDEKMRLPECGFYWDDKPDPDLQTKVQSSSDSEDEANEQSKQKKKKLNAAERRERERQREREIREREEALASNQLPNSVDQFDRLVLASPDSSLIWLQYMAYHLQATEIEKARAVARRAIKTISFREENEKLNVWNAWLNLESKFGTPETLNDVFQEAVRANDALKIYTHMLTVHVEAGRQTELEKLISTMIGKFKQKPEVWIECGTALLNVGLKDKSRHIMQRALQSLPSSQHINLMVRFANLENKLGEKERSQTLFEQILSSYPKRVDVWSSYVDSLIKSGDVEIARKVLERAVVQTLPARKMKSLFKKFIGFEERYGTPEAVTRIQEMAVEYVEKQCAKESV